MLRTAGILLVLAACSTTAARAPAAAPVSPAAPPVAPTAARHEPPALSGIWLGTLQAGGSGLRIQLHLDLAPATCSLDSLDQHTSGIPCDHVVASATALSLEVPAVHGTLTGAVSADGNTVTATWTQGTAAIPVILTRQAAALEATKVATDPAMPAVDVDQIQAVMDKDLQRVLAGELAPATGIGVTIGVVEHGVRKVFSYGAAKPDSVFEIGSITKTFTGLMLAQMVQQKQARLDEPVRALLPKGTVAAPASGAEITLLDLSTQRSGLPRLPDNMTPADATNPYADYDAKALYAFIASHGVAMPARPDFGYSNLGVGLLGQALADRAGTTYEALVRREVTGPLGMKDTAITLTAAVRKRFLAGHGAGRSPQRAWDFAALVGAGGLRSTAADMLTFLDAQLHPEHVKGITSEARTLAAALVASHQVRGEAGGGMHIALNWFRSDETGSYWHNGATGGFSSFALFDPKRDFAVVILVNRSVDDGAFADELGKHLVQRLTGAPAESLAR